MGKKNRIWWRDENGRTPRAYGDFRDFSDVGGGLEALKPTGSNLATTDPDVARVLVAKRLKALEEARRYQHMTGLQGPMAVEDFVAHHVELKRAAGEVRKKYADRVEAQLGVAVEFFGAERHVDTLSVTDVREFTNWLLRRPNGRGGTLSRNTVRRYLSALSHLFTRPQSEGVVRSGHNPVSSMMDKPRAETKEAEWLTTDEAARLLEAARTFEPHENDRAYPFIYPLLATFLLTGGRRTEVRGLEVRDIHFERRTVTFRPNRWRDLKTAPAHRSVPLWPQLDAILHDYLQGPRSKLGGQLLFPSTWKDEEGESMIRDLRGIWDRLGEEAGLEKTVRTKMFRHTYCATRLQSLDNGHPVAEFTVMKEMGHGGPHMVRRVYGHLGSGEDRYRAEGVAYRLAGAEDLEGTPKFGQVFDFETYVKGLFDPSPLDELRRAAGG